MSDDVEVIARVLVDAFKEKKREEHEATLTNKVVALGQAGAEKSVYIKDYQKASIHKLLMEFYRIMHRDNPSTLFSDVEKEVLNKFGVKGLEFLTVERFDQVVMDLLNDIGSYHDAPFNGGEDECPGFSINDYSDAYIIFDNPKTENIVTYLLGTEVSQGYRLAN